MRITINWSTWKTFAMRVKSGLGSFTAKVSWPRKRKPKARK